MIDYVDSVVHNKYLHKLSSNIGIKIKKKVHVHTSTGVGHYLLGIKLAILGINPVCKILLLTLNSAVVHRNNPFEVETGNNRK